MQYNPEQPVDREAWLALDEQERIEAVRRYHRRRKIRLPNEGLHAITHVVVENQVALGRTFPAESVLLRLIGEGLGRHDAIHAIGSVLAEYMFAAVAETNRDFANADYVRDIEHLTAESCRSNRNSGGTA